MNEQNEEVVKGVYAAFAEGDVPSVLGKFAEGIEWYEAEGMPYGGLHRGGDAIVQNVFGPLAEDIDGFTVTPEEMMSSGETVIAVVRYTGSGKVTANTLDLPVVHVWDLDDGMIVRFRQFADTVKFGEVVPVADSVVG